jgi:exonuclease SbcC
MLRAQEAAEDLPAVDLALAQDMRLRLEQARKVAALHGQIVAAGSERAELARRREQAEADLQRELADALRVSEKLEADLRSEEAAHAARLAAADRAAAEAVVNANRALEAAEQAAAALRREHSDAHAASQMVADLESRVGTAQASHDAATAREREAGQRRAAAWAQVQDAERRLVDVEERATAAREIERELGDWRILEQALGKDGIQALEIDAAGPEVAALTNDLLEACYGPRFSIAFETLREKRSARGEFSEVFDVKVFDSGRERPVEALSGGEKVVVGEALGLAFSIFNARRSGIRWETLFRDETAGALDPQNAQAYVDMLRRALALGGFQQVLFVSHSPEVWERADARVRVHDGQVSIS